MRDEQPPLQALQRLGGDILKGRRRRHHGIADTGQLLDERRNRHAGIDQLLPLTHGTVGIDLDDADFGDAVKGGGGTGGFEVDEGEGFAVHGGAEIGTGRDDTARTCKPAVAYFSLLPCITMIVCCMMAHSVSLPSLQA